MNGKTILILALLAVTGTAMCFCATGNTKDEDIVLQHNTASGAAAISKTRQAEASINFIETYKDPKSEIESEELYYTIEYYSQLYNIDVAILTALMRKESGFFQGAKSRKDCYGICQISWGALDRYNTINWGKNSYKWSEIKKRYDINLDVACWYLTWLWKNFDTITTLRELLIAYNVGPSDLPKYKNKKGYHYADDIICWAKELKQYICN